jgi:hypothetical protein
MAKTNSSEKSTRKFNLKYFIAPMVLLLLVGACFFAGGTRNSSDPSSLTPSFDVDLDAKYQEGLDAVDKAYNEGMSNLIPDDAPAYVTDGASLYDWFVSEHMDKSSDETASELFEKANSTMESLTEEEEVSEWDANSEIARLQEMLKGINP